MPQHPFLVSFIERALLSRQKDQQNLVSFGRQEEIAKTAILPKSRLPYIFAPLNFPICHSNRLVAMAGTRRGMCGHSGEESGEGVGAQRADGARGCIDA